MGKSSINSKKKNKGPKGKRARAKAKLQRQWGEVALDHQDQGHNSKSKSRRTEASSSSSADKKKLAGTKHRVPVDETAAHNGKDDELMRAMDSSDHDSDNDNDNNAVDSFLQQLKRSNEQKDNDSDDDEDAYGDDNDDEMGQDETHGNNRMQQDDDNDDEPEHDFAVIPTVDLFSERFSRPPLPEQQAELDRAMQRVQTTTTLPDASLGLPSGLQVQVSTQWLKERDLWLSPTNKDTNEDDNRRRLLLQRWNAQCQACFANNRAFLQEHWKLQTPPKFPSPLQRTLYPLLASYMDVLLAVPTTPRVRRETTRTTVLHLLNHVYTTRQRISKHNQRLLKDEDEDNEEEGATKQTKDTDDDHEWARDQGYTRPTVLVLLPTRSVCYDFVQQLTQLVLGGNDSDLALLTDANVVGAERFHTEYGPPPAEDDDENATDAQRSRRRRVLEQKGPEWLELFGDHVNADDDFKLGLSVQQAHKVPQPQQQLSSQKKQAGRRQALKLYSDFYHSDILLASPLGLKMACTAQGGDEDNDDEPSRAADVADNNGAPQADFLSSIEICLLQRSDVLLMQNWDHVQDILKLLNQPPASAAHTDFSRVRHYLLAGQAAHWRQLIVQSEWVDPMILSCFSQFAQSGAGLARLRQRTVSVHQASLGRVLLNLRHVFRRVPCASLLQQTQAKVDYFCQHILPDLVQPHQTHTLVFIPSYFDFVALRNALMKRDDNVSNKFGTVTEYSSASEVSRNRARFVQGRKSLLLYTGRAHFFHRHAIRGVRHLIFLGPPEHAHFVSDLVNQMMTNDGGGDDNQDPNTAATPNTCLALFTKYDAHALERIVGRDHCKRMVSGDKQTFFFDS